MDSREACSLVKIVTELLMGAIKDCSGSLDSNSFTVAMSAKHLLQISDDMSLFDIEVVDNGRGIKPADVVNLKNLLPEPCWNAVVSAKRLSSGDEESLLRISTACNAKNIRTYTFPSRVTTTSQEAQRVSGTSIRLSCVCSVDEEQLAAISSAFAIHSLLNVEIAFEWHYEDQRRNPPTHLYLYDVGGGIPVDLQNDLEQKYGPFKMRFQCEDNDMATLKTKDSCFECCVFVNSNTETYMGWEEVSTSFVRNNVSLNSTDAFNLATALLASQVFESADGSETWEDLIGATFSSGIGVQSLCANVWDRPLQRYSSTSSLRNIILVLSQKFESQKLNRFLPARPVTPDVITGMRTVLGSALRKLRARRPSMLQLDPASQLQLWLPRLADSLTSIIARSDNVVFKNEVARVLGLENLNAPDETDARLQMLFEQWFTRRAFAADQLEADEAAEDEMPGGIEEAVAEEDEAGKEEEEEAEEADV